MSLSSSILNDYYVFLEDLLRVINDHVVSENYVVIKRRIEVFSEVVGEVGLEGWRVEGLKVVEWITYITGGLEWREGKGNKIKENPHLTFCVYI